MSDEAFEVKKKEDGTWAIYIIQKGYKKKLFKSQGPEDAGKFGYIFLDDKGPDDYLRVEDVFINSDMRRKGYAKKLYKRAVELAKSKGYKKGIASPWQNRNELSNKIWKDTNKLGMFNVMSAGSMLNKIQSALRGQNIFSCVYDDYMFVEASSSNPITDELKRITKRYKAKGLTPYQINDGECAEVSDEVVRNLENEKPVVFEVELNSFRINSEDSQAETGDFDVKLLTKHWPKVKPPRGLTWKDMGKIAFGFHVWITDGKKHYDVEAPNGVENFFDLPIFARSIKKKSRSKK